MRNQIRKSLCFLRRVAGNTTANALPVMAVALIPVLTVVGGGMDYARASLAKARLQEAVDSAALAGRRAMSNNDLETARATVNAYIAFNFTNGTYGTSPLNIELTKPATGVVRVRATTTLDTTLLALAGLDKFNIGAVGEATQNLDNVDVMLVLDTTGSMAEKLDGKTKLETLKTAVRSLYKELEPAQTQLAAQGMRMRIGIVPYSGSVNVGKVLLAKSAGYLATQHTYYHNFYYNGNWYIGARTYNLSNYIGGAKFGSPNGHNSGSQSRWAGCVEERQTVSTITANDGRTAAPAAALDLDIDLIPTDDKSRWKPYIAEPSRGDTNMYCPSEVTPLAELHKNDIETQLGKLVAQGSTYHDVGMIWATRMLSPGGIFGSDNPSTYNGRPVHRYIIYMTDGEMSAPLGGYSAYGLEYFDRRVGGSSDSDNSARHSRRFQMACNAAKSRNVSVWTIAFGTSNNASLTACASNADQTSVAANSDALISKFAEIGRNIGALRLSQ